MARAKAFMDKYLERWTSRKLLVWSTATTFLALGKLGPDEWVAVSLAYIGIQGLADIATRWKHGEGKQNNEQ
tara:strand:- start:86 stop:301 length:216 start_codon:yes stop_codon:yes gene_type:complete